jgi:hypothetical protein
MIYYDPRKLELLIKVNPEFSERSVKKFISLASLHSLTLSAPYDEFWKPVPSRRRRCSGIP